MVPTLGMVSPLRPQVRHLTSQKNGSESYPCTWYHSGDDTLLSFPGFAHPIIRAACIASLRKIILS